MSALAVLIVSFNITPTLQEPGTPPRLRVTVRNDGDAPLTVDRFGSDACFAQFLLELPLTLPDGTRPPAEDCPALSFPGVKGTLAPHASEQHDLDLAKIFPGVKWVRGRYLLSPKWKTGASQTSVNVQAFDLAPSLGKVRVERGKEVVLPDGARLSFTAHGHKRTLEGGPPSPLIIHGAFAGPKQKALEPFEAKVFGDESRLFTVGEGFTFELVKHEYDGWMELVYFGKR